MKVAVIGTGTMGAGMARSLQREGHEVRAWNRTRSKAEPLADDGITVADSVGDAVQGADVALTMLFDVDSVLTHGDELTGALGDGVWLQTATVGPDGMARIAEAYPDANLLDCPVLGTKKPAEEGKLVPLVAGDKGLIERVQPVLDAIASKTVVAGSEVGQGSRLKLACNAWLFSLTAAAAQSIALTEALGLDGVAVPAGHRGRPGRQPVRPAQGRDDAQGRLDAVVRDRRRPQGPRPDRRRHPRQRRRPAPDRAGQGPVRRGVGGQGTRQ